MATARAHATADADFMRAGVRDDHGLAVRRPRQSPRIGRAAIDVVHEHGVDDLQLVKVDSRLATSRNFNRLP